MAPLDDSRSSSGRHSSTRKRPLGSRGSGTIIDTGLGAGFGAGFGAGTNLFDGTVDLIDRVFRAEHARLEGRAYDPVRLGEYELERLVGSGGMGHVFAARRQGAGASTSLVALKLLHRSTGGALLRLKQEFRVLADVDHPNLVHLGELVVDASAHPFFTMELLEGCSFVEYVRGLTPAGQLPNQPRLRRALRQLLTALEQLHGLGLVHRDLKPSNVLVTPQGRVVVLDFGLVCDAEAHDGANQAVVGTPAYMAPEQARCERAGPAADLYAVGVMLYECLCSSRPFSGRAQEVLLAKLDEDSPALVVRIPHADPDLLALCSEMLAHDPERRPSAAEALARLERAPRNHAHTRHFVGRVNELAQLDAALTRARLSDRSLMVRLWGPAGQGKTALLERWLSDLAPELLVLRGRCLVRESVAYRGLDPLVDALSAQLRELPEHERLALCPTCVAPLVHLFPVLAGIWPLSTTHVDGLAPSELRERAMSALRELLGAVARTRPTLVVIDNFQWADAASVRMLETLLHERCAPSLMLVFAQRERSSTASAPLTALAANELVELVELPLGPLPWSEARELVLPALGDNGRDSRLLARARALVHDSGGNPLHLCELLRGVASELDAELDLDELIAGRIEALEPELHEALALVALAQVPLSRAVLLAAQVTAPCIDALLEAELLWRPSTDTQLVETTHDRIREAVLAELDTQTLPRLHLRLAQALIIHDPHAHAEFIAEHYDRGARPLLALRYAELAARAATAKLAFARAVHWYERCLELLPPARSPMLREQLERALAEACANSGHLVRAAELHLAHAHSSPPDAASHEQRARAVEYLLKAGRTDEGLAIASDTLAELGLAAPREGLERVLATRDYRPRLARDLRRFRVGTPRPSAQTQRAPAQALRLAEFCAKISDSLLLQSGARSLRFLGAARSFAVELGDAKLFARTLGKDALIAGLRGDTSRATELVLRARELSEDSELNHLTLDLYDAALATYAGEWPRAIELAERVLPKLAARANMQWERRLCVELRTWAQLESGDYRAAIPVARRAMQLGVEVGDLRQARDNAGFLAWGLASSGELDEAQHVLARLHEQECELGTAAPYGVSTWLRDRAWVELLLRTGRPREALATLAQMRVQMKRSGLWAMPAYRDATLARRGLASLAVHVREPGRRTGRQLRVVLRALRRAGPHYEGIAAVFEASLAHKRGHAQRAIDALDEASAHFTRSGSTAQLAVVHARRALLLGEHSELGARAKSKAAAYFDHQEIRLPQGLLDALCPLP